MTDDFVPFLTDRLKKLSQQHNVLLVTNDHIEALTNMADNIITVSAIDRTVVQINDEAGIDRNKVILALSVGQTFRYEDSNADLSFFWRIEVTRNKSLRQILRFMVIMFALYILTFWDSPLENAALVLIAGGIIGYFCIQPYLVSLVDWRNRLNEEAEALVHASPMRSRILKMLLTLTAIFLISSAEFLAVNAVTGFANFAHIRFYVAMVGELFSLCLPNLFLSLFTTLPFQTVSIFSGLPFLLVIL